MSNYCGSRIQGFAPPTGAILLATKRPQSDTGLWINSAVCGDPFAKRATRSVLSANGRPNPDSTTHRYSDVTARQRKNFLGKFATVHDSKLTTQPSICLQTTRVGLVVGFTTGSVIIWTVFAKTNRHKGMLTGTYTGASAEMSLAAGLGVNVLVGGSSQTVALQLLSVQGQIGLNIAAGVGSLDLHPSW